MRQDAPGPGGLVSPTEFIGGYGLRRPSELIKHLPGCHRQDSSGRPE